MEQLYTVYLFVIQFIIWPSHYDILFTSYLLLNFFCLRLKLWPSYTH